MDDSERVKNGDTPIWRNSQRTRTTPVLQSQEGECGLACLAMIATTLGIHSTLHELRSRFRTSSRGSTLHQLVSHAEKLGLTCRVLRLEPSELHKLSLPAMLHWDMSHYLVLEKVARGFVIVCDPSRGRRKLSHEEVFKCFTGVALEAWTTDGKRSEKDESQRTFASKLADFEGIWPTLALLLALTGLLEGLALMSPLLSQWLVDEATGRSGNELIVTMGVAFVLIQMFQHGVTYLRGLIANHLGCDLSLKRKTGFFRHLICLPHSFFERRSVGDIASRFASVEAIQQTLLSSVGTFVIDGLVAIASLAILLTYHPQIALISIMSLSSILVIRALTFPRLREVSAGQIEHAARAQSHLLETLRGVRVIQIFGRQRDRSLSWHNLLVAQYNTMYRAIRLRSNVGQLCGLIGGLEGIAVLCCGASAVIAGSWTLGALMAFSAYRSSFATRSIAVLEKLVELAMLRLHFDRLEDISRTECDNFTVDDDEGAGPSISEGVFFSDVTFRYAHGETTLLKCVNLSIAEGECVALIGASGSGKTTLAKLLLGIIDPVKGEIHIGGHSGHRLRALTRSGTVAAVMQDDTLFAGSVEENIHCFDPEPDLSRVISCAVAARIHDDIIEMPMSYMTLVGDMGSTLSGGQRQRLTLARALYRRPKLLILDEATSHLDVNNEALISAAIRELKITTIVIAHRPETIASADRLIELRDGELLEHQSVTR